MQRWFYLFHYWAHCNHLLDWLVEMSNSLSTCYVWDQGLRYFDLALLRHWPPLALIATQNFTDRVQQWHILSCDAVRAKVRARTACHHVIDYFHTVTDLRQSEGGHRKWSLCHFLLSFSLQSCRKHRLIFFLTRLIYIDSYSHNMLTILGIDSVNLPGLQDLYNRTAAICKVEFHKLPMWSIATTVPKKKKKKKTSCQIPETKF